MAKKLVSKPHQSGKTSKRVQPEEGFVVMKEKVAVLKGYLTEASAIDWPEDVSSACVKHADFLKKWLTFEHSKPACRVAIKDAFPQLPSAKARKLLDGLCQSKSFLRKKWQNLKTGDKTHPTLVSLMEDIFGNVKGRSMSVSVETLQENVDEERESDSKPAMASGSGHSQKPVKALTILPHGFTTEGPQETPGDVQSVVSISSIGEIGAEELKKAATTTALTSISMKRPAAKKGDKKKESPPGLVKTKGKKESITVQRPEGWIESASFGFMKATYASQKAYIVYKSKKDAKATCLVNVNLPRGDQQTEVMRKCLAEARLKNRTKDDIVNLKNSCLQKL